MITDMLHVCLSALRAPTNKTWRLCMVLACAAVLTGTAEAGLIGAQVDITSEISGNPPSGFASVTVTTPGVELPNGEGLDFFENILIIDIEADSITLDVKGFFWVSSMPFQGLRFSGLKSPGQVISGFSVASTIGGVSDVFLASAITFGTTSLNVDLQNGPINGQEYRAGDQIRITLEFGPAAAVPEPSSVVMLGVAGLGLLGVARRRRG